MKSEEQVRRYLRKVKIMIEGMRLLTGMADPRIESEFVALKWVLGEVDDPPDLDDGSLDRAEDAVQILRSK